METPLISVIVPVYNAEQYLDKCITSILNQTYPNIEVILVDDGSTDKSPEICDNYAGKDTRVRVFKKENGGAGSARNLGLAQCRGEYISFVDSDDWISLNMIEDLLQKCIDNEVPLSINQIVSLDGFYSEQIEIGTFYAEVLLRKLIEGSVGGSANHRLIRRDLFGNILFGTQRVGEDFVFMIKLLSSMVKKQQKIVVSKDSQYYYSDNPQSLMHTTDNVFQEDMQNIRTIISENIEIGNDLQDLLKRRFVSLLLGNIANLLTRNDRKTCRERIKELKLTDSSYISWNLWGIRHKFMYIIVLYSPYLWRFRFVSAFCTKCGSIPPFNK